MSNAVADMTNTRTQDVCSDMPMPMPMPMSIDRSYASGSSFVSFVTPGMFADQFEAAYTGVIEDAKEQADAMRAFASGQLTYAQMRELCG
jgi:hypothetical protein